MRNALRSFRYFMLDSKTQRSLRELESYKKVPAENNDLPISNKFKMRGAGVTRHTLLHPFGRKTKTTFEVQPRMFAPVNGDDVNAERTDAPAYDPQYFSPVQVQMPSKIVAELNVFRDDNYRSDLLATCAISFGNQEAINPLLTHSLNKCGDDLKLGKIDSKAAQVPLLLGLQRACADAAEAAAAQGGQPVTEMDVVRALNYLRGQDLHQAVIAPGGPAELAATNATQTDQERIASDLAWRLAYKLAVTERGMDLLYRLTDARLPGTGADIDAEEKNRQRRQHLNLKHFFKTADALLNENAERRLTLPGPSLAATPGELLEHCFKQCERSKPPSNTLLIHGLTGIQTALCKEDSNAPRCLWQQRIDRTDRIIRNIGVNRRQYETLRPFGRTFGETFLTQMGEDVEKAATKYAALRARQQAAMEDRFAFKWVSDGHVSNAQGSLLHTIDQRNKKIDVYQQRRRNRGERKGLSAFAQRSLDIVKGSNRTFVPPPRTEDVQHNPDSMLLHREVMQSSLSVLEEMLLRGGGASTATPQPLDPSRYVLEDNPERPILKNIARLALTRFWLKHPLHYLSNDLPPTPYDIDKLTSHANLTELFGDNPAFIADGPERCALIEAFKAVLPRPSLSPELLSTWEEEIKLPATGVDGAAPVQTPGREHANKSGDQLREDFGKLISTLQNGWTSTLNPRGNTVEDFNQMLIEQIKQMRLGNLRTFSGGTSHGITVPVFSELVSRIKSMGTVGVLVGANYSRRAMVNLEVGIASWGGFIRVTTSKENQLGANLGVTLGPKMEIGDAVGGAAIYADSEGAGTLTQAKGYCFCLPRGGQSMTGRDGSKAGVNGDAELAKGLAEIWSILNSNSDESGGAQDALPGMGKLRKIGEQVPDVSVSLIGPGDSHSEEGYAGVRAGAILGVYDRTKTYGIGLNASANVLHLRRKSHYQQRTSALQLDIANKTRRTTLNAGVNLPLAPGIGRQGGHVAAFNNGAQSIAGPSFGVGGANADLWKHGIATQTNRVIYEGKISKNTYANIFYTNAKEFCDNVEKNMARWANYMAAHDPDNPEPSTPPNYVDEQGRTIADIRQCLVDKHTDAIRKYLARIKREVHQSNVYFDFLELTPESTDMLNHYRESEMEFRAAGHLEGAKLCKKAFDAVWKSDAAWAPYFIVNSVPQFSNSGWSFNLIASLASEQPETSNRFPNYCG